MRTSLAMICAAALCACAGRSRPPSGGVSGAVPSPSMVAVDEPVYGTEGFSTPRTKEPECVHRSLRVSAALAPLLLPQVVVAQFAIGRTGDVSRFALTTPIASESVQRAIARAVEDAVRACEWVPARDPEGNAVQLWVVLPVRFTKEPALRQPPGPRR